MVPLHPTTGWQTIAVSILSTGLLLLTACDKEDGEEGGKASAPEKTLIEKTPLPSLPAWATSFLGVDTRTMTASKRCIGSFDVVKVRHTGEPAGVEAEGWAWLVDDGKPPERMIFADENGYVIGAGETNRDRPDVPKVVHEIKTARVGWHAQIKATGGQVIAFALLPDGSACSIGSKPLA